MSLNCSGALGCGASVVCANERASTNCTCLPGYGSDQLTIVNPPNDCRFPRDQVVVWLAVNIAVAAAGTAVLVRASATVRGGPRRIQRTFAFAYAALTVYMISLLASGLTHSLASYLLIAPWATALMYAMEEIFFCMLVPVHAVVHLAPPSRWPGRIRCGILFLLIVVLSSVAAAHKESHPAVHNACIIMDNFLSFCYVAGFSIATSMKAGQLLRLMSSLNKDLAGVQGSPSGRKTEQLAYFKKIMSFTQKLAPAMCLWSFLIGAIPVALYFGPFAGQSFPFHFVTLLALLSSLCGFPFILARVYGRNSKIGAMMDSKSPGGDASGNEGGTGSGSGGPPGGPSSGKVGPSNNELVASSLPDSPSAARSTN